MAQPSIAGRLGTLAAMSRLDRIATEPLICHGKPTIRGLRYPVETLLELLATASGMTIDAVLGDHPDLSARTCSQHLSSER